MDSSSGTKNWAFLLFNLNLLLMYGFLGLIFILFPLYIWFGKFDYGLINLGSKGKEDHELNKGEFTR